MVKLKMKKKPYKKKKKYKAFGFKLTQKTQKKIDRAFGSLHKRNQKKTESPARRP